MSHPQESWGFFHFCTTERILRHLSLLHPFASTCPHKVALDVVHVNLASSRGLGVSLIHSNRQEPEWRDLSPTPWIIYFFLSFIQGNWAGYKVNSSSPLILKGHWIILVYCAAFSMDTAPCVLQPSHLAERMEEKWVKPVPLTIHCHPSLFLA